MGKSALTWELFARAARGEWFLSDTFEHVVWYSLYDATSDLSDLLTFLARVLGISPSPSIADTCDAVLSSLAGKAVLLFLDGLERLLSYYQRSLDIGRLGVSDINDDVLKSEGGLSFSSRIARRFFATLLSATKCKLVASSRVVPRDLAARSDVLGTRIAVLALAGLPLSDSRILTETYSSCSTLPSVTGDRWRSLWDPRDSCPQAAPEARKGGPSTFTARPLQQRQRRESRRVTLCGRHGLSLDVGFDVLGADRGRLCGSCRRIAGGCREPPRGG